MNIEEVVKNKSGDEQIDQTILECSQPPVNREHETS